MGVERSAPRPNSQYHLVVEGSDDKHTIIQLLARSGFDWEDGARLRPYIHAAGSCEEALAEFRTVLKLHPRVGLVIDANGDVASRWQAVRQRAQEAGVAMPGEPCSDGLVDASLLPSSRFGVWLMPDNQNHGALERFLATLIPASDPRWPIAEEATVRCNRALWMT